MAHPDYPSRTGSEGPQRGFSKTLTELLRTQAAHLGDELAYAFLSDGETVRDRLTYAELDRQAQRIAGVLKTHGACGQPVLLLYPPGLEYVAAFFGCIYAGAIAVPAYPPHRNRSLDRLESIVGDSGARTVLCTTAVRESIERMAAEAPELHALDWLATDAPGTLDVEPYCDESLTADRIAFLQYTSGSTSAPKGVMLSHGNLCHNARLIWNGFHFDETSTSVFWLPLYHDMGLIGGILQPLHIGRTSYLMAPATFLASPVRWLRAITTYGATISGAPNFAYDLCATRVPLEQRAGLDLSRWRVAFNGAEPIRAATLERFAAEYAPYGFQPTAAYPCYGLAESTLIVTGGLHERPPVTLSVSRSSLERHHVETIAAEHSDARVLVGCGRPLLDQRVVIVDPETLIPCPPERPGEIWVGGPSVAQGYWQRTEESDRIFGARTVEGDGPFMRTGDLGFLNDDELYVTGRIKDLIILRGRNLYPQDIEQTAEASHPALRNGCGAAVAVDGTDGERLVFICEAERTERTVPVEIVAAAVSAAIATKHEALVDAVVLLRPGSTPKTSSGKIQRHACKACYLNGTLEAIGIWERTAEIEITPTAVVAPAATRSSDEIQAWLVERIARKLRVSLADLDPREPLARYGLDSLTAVQTVGELEQWLGRPLSPVLLYDHPTIEALAHFLAGSEKVSGTFSAAGNVPDTFSEPIAVVGIGCRFPGADGPAAFWRLLRDGVDAITEVPADRWNVDEYFSEHADKPGKMNTRWGGFLTAVDRFDRGFFGIAPREAERMDPQQRMLLETTWEALEDAGQDPLAGSRNVGVFVGISSNDYARLQGGPATLDAYVGTGNAMSIAANRLSYAFDFRGPSMAVDTACSSSLVAIHLACQSLRRGETELAVAAGVNLILTPDLTVNFTRAGMMSPDGRCKAFDADANGYVRGEGCGVVVLKPLSKALADGDPVYAVVRGSAVNQDGRSNGLTAPNRQAQESVLRAAYRDAGVSPADIDAIEAHGTGTSLGDPIEALALGSVLTEGRPVDRPALLGSVKTNIGHLESAAGVAGFIKTALSLKHGEALPSLHFNKANPHIPFEQLPLRVVTERQTWPDRGRATRIGVSSFGFGGTNAHIVLESVQPSPIACEVSDAKPQLIPLSARTPEALRDLAQKWIEFGTTTEAPLSDLAFTATRRHGHHDHRLTVVAKDRAELATKLTAWLADDPHADTFAGRRLPNRSARPVWVFAGQGPQWWGMGRKLLESEPVFRSAIEACDAAFQPLAGWSLVNELQNQNDDARLDDTDRVQPVLFALQVGLAALWQSWGIEPAAVVGHSLGEVAAAFVAGALTLLEAVQVVYHRSRLQHRLSGHGKMAAVGLSAEESTTALRGFEDRLALAAINGPKATVWSGDPAALELALKPLAQRDVFHRQLRGQVAFHSPQMDSLRDELAASLTGLTPKPASIPFYSTVTGTAFDGDKLDAAYWARNIREPVQFGAAADALIAAGFELFLELSPHSVLKEPLHQCLRHRKTVGSFVPSLRRGEDDRASMLAAVGGLYAAGAEAAWDVIVRAGQVVPLPSYPWQRERCWFEAPKVGHNGYHRNGYTPSLNGHAHEPTVEDKWLVRPTWTPIATPTEPARLSGTWLVVTDESRIADRLGGLLRERGADRIVVAASGAEFKSEGADRFRFDPADPAQVKRLVREAVPSPADLAGVLHLSPAGPSVDSLSSDELAAAQERGVVAVLHIVQSLTANAANARLWLVTRGAQAVVDGDAAHVAQAPVWGLGRVLAHEHPELRVTLADFDATPTFSDLPDLVSILSADSDEKQLAFRDGKLLAARVTAAEHAAPSHGPALRVDATYLVTGGLGGLGLQIAGWLVAHGARSLVLTGRRGATPESEITLAGLRAIGARIVVAKADAADYEQLAAVIAEIDETMPPLRGVIHAAGVLDDGIALQQTRDRLRTVLAPKLLGGWHLHSLTSGRRLDFFALFSSAASLLGSPGQSNYAAANAALDGLAAFRRARGLPCVSINWGPWSGAGMAARDGKADHLAKAGMGLIDPARGLDLFGRLLASPFAQVGVIPADWAAYRRMAGGRLSPFLASLAGPEDDSQRAGEPAERVPSALNRDALHGVPQDDWQPILEGQLREQAARVLRLSAAALDIDLPLNNVGIDSLMAIELKNRIEADLGVTVPMVKFLEGPSVRDLAATVYEHLQAAQRKAPTADSGADATWDRQTEIDVEALSDDQVDALLAELTAAEKGD